MEAYRAAAAERPRGRARLPHGPHRALGSAVRLRSVQVYRLREEMTDPALEYPDYFRRAFHGYRQGNMTWQAAFEAEPATQVIAKRLYSEADPDLSPEACALKERQAYVCAVQVRASWPALLAEQRHPPRQLRRAAWRRSTSAARTL